MKKLSLALILILFAWNAHAWTLQTSWDLPLADGWYTWDAYSVAEAGVSFSPAAPDGNTTTMRVTIQAGSTGGQQYGGGSIIFPSETDEVWAQFYFRYSSNYQFHSNGDKFSGWECSTGGCGNMMELWYYGQATMFQQYATDAMRNGVWDWLPNQSYFPGQQVDHWYKVNQHLKMNTPGQFDGVYEMWIDDQLVMSYSNVGYREASNSNGFTKFRHVVVWGGGSGEPPTPSDQYVYYGTSIVSTTAIDSGSAPYVSSRSPTSDSTGVPISNRTIQIGLASSTDVLTANGNVNIEGTNYTCSSGLNCTGGGTSAVTVTYTKGSDWAYGQVVNVSMSGFRNTAGNIMATDNWSYTTELAVPTLRITTTSLPSGVVGQGYNQPVIATGGVQPRVFTLDSGSLPSGLNLSSSGVISGTPTGAGTSNFVVKVTDNVATIATQEFSIMVSATGDIGIINNRYLTDASGAPMFLTGTWDSWVTVDNTVTTDKWQNQWVITDNLSLRGMNYTRQMNDHPNNQGHTLYPYTITGGKFRLDLFNATWWSKLHDLLVYRGTLGINTELPFFEGAGLWNYSWSYANSPWNPANHYSAYYSSIDDDSDGFVDEDGEFFDLTAFNNNTGIGYYQRQHIAKIISETDDLPNVFYNVGNETGRAPVAWIEAVQAYARSLTNKPVGVSICLGGYEGCATNLASIDSVGFSESHLSDTPAEVKSYTASFVSKGYPFMDDPDGSALMDGTAADLRKAVWYALTGGAAGWLGYHEGDGLTMPMEALLYYQYLQQFIEDQSVQFWEMTPQHSLVSSNSINSLLANVGTSYLAYVLSDSSITVTMTSGTYTVKYFNPADNTTTSESNKVVTSTSAQTFNKPSGASDWVVYVNKYVAPVVYVTTSSLPAGTVDNVYNTQLEASGGNPTPYSWTLYSGTLPPGINLLDNGTLVGHPTTAGTYNFSVQAMDQSANAGIGVLSIVISPLLPGGQYVTTNFLLTDTYVRGEDSADTNFSDNTYNRTYQWPSYSPANRTIVQVANLGLPDNILITEALIYVYLETWSGSGGSTPMNLYAHPVTGQTWGIDNVTWNTLDNSVVGSYESVTEVPLEVGWYSFTVTEAVKAAYAADSAFTALVDGRQDGVADTNRYFTSMEGAEAHRPYLSTTYTLLDASGLRLFVPGSVSAVTFDGTIY